MSVHDRGRGAAGKRWEVRWRDATGGQHKRRFETREQALAADAKRRTVPDEARAFQTVGALFESWAVVKAATVKPATWALYASDYRLHVAPRWATTRANAVREWAVREWAAGIASPSTRRRAVVVLRQLLASAGVPWVGVRAGQAPRAAVAPLDAAAIHQVAAACAPHDDVVLLLATTGVRFGEMAALTVGDVDARRRRIAVTRQVTTVDGRLVRGTPKGGRSRTVPVPGWLLARLDLARPSSAVLLPTPAGGVWRHSSWKRVWARARQRVATQAERDREAGLEVRAVDPWPRVHDLRHAAARLAIEAGLDLRSLQVMLGHASLTTTVDLYGALAGDRLDGFEALIPPPPQGRTKGA